MKRSLSVAAMMLGAMALLAFPLAGFALGEHPEHPSKKEVTIADISAGIKAHIEAQAKAGGGAMRVMDGDKELQLTLVKVHEERLSNLGDGSYFACVDMKGSDGNTYDLDFFLTGDPGSMKVTETAVHKLNGQPRYGWKEQDGKWVKVPIAQ